MKRKFHSLHFVVLTMIFSLSVGCAKKLDDAKMSSDIQSKYSQDSGLASKQLTVQANNGVVTLSGTVDNEAQRQAAARQAAAEPGVKTVINNLQVGDSSAMASASQKPMPGDAAPAPDSAAASAPPAEKSKPAKAKKTRHHQAEDSGAGQGSGQQQIAANNPPPDNSAAPPPAENTAPAPPPPPAPKKLIIDQGTQLTIRLVDPIDSEKNQTGDTFHATLNAPLTSDGEQAVPAGVELVGHLVDVRSAGKFKGQSVVVLQLDSLSAGGKTYNLQTDQYRKEGKSRGKNTAEKVGGGAILGGIIGAIAGGGKGAAIGTAAGAGVGAGAQEVSKSQQIKLPSETVLNFTLQAPITVVQAASPDANRPNLGDSR